MRNCRQMLEYVFPAHRSIAGFRSSIDEYTCIVLSFSVSISTMFNYTYIDYMTLASN